MRALRGRRGSVAPVSDAQPKQPVSRELRQARLAVAAIFLTNGALYANLVPRLPEIKAALSMSNAVYGLTVAAFPLGALVSGLFAAVCIRRWGSANVATVGTLLLSIGILLAGVAPSVALFGLAMFTAGAMDSVTDVGQNSHALRVQRAYGRSIINSFHALWSVGTVLGGAMAAAAIVLGLPIATHLAISAAIFVAVAVVARRFLLQDPEPDDDATDDVTDTTTGASKNEEGHATNETNRAAAPNTGDGTESADGADESSPVSPQMPTPTRASPSRRQTQPKQQATPRTWLLLLALSIIAICGGVVEDASGSWATLYLGETLGASAALAPAGYLTLMGAELIGRILGDPMTDRMGRVNVARLGGVLILVGMGLALAFPTIPGTLAGFAAAGFGAATLVPAGMHQADELPGLRPGTGLTVLSWFLRAGFLAGPPIVGAIADAAGLRVGLLVMPLAGIAVLLLAGALRDQRPRPTN